MADAAYALLSRDSAHYTGNFVIDDEILREEGVQDFDQYAFDPGNFYGDYTAKQQNSESSSTTYFSAITLIFVILERKISILIHIMIVDFW